MKYVFQRPDLRDTPAGDYLVQQGIDPKDFEFLRSEDYYLNGMWWLSFASPSDPEGTEELMYTRGRAAFSRWSAHCTHAVLDLGPVRLEDLQMMLDTLTAEAAEGPGFPKMTVITGSKPVNRP